MHIREINVAGYRSLRAIRFPVEARFASGSARGPQNCHKIRV
jgi:hypothetical protein